jgi:hypothetical protein
MKVKLAVALAVLLFASAIPAYADSSTVTVTLNFNETNVLNGTGFIGLGSNGSGPMYGTGYEVLSIGINWSDTGTPNPLYSIVYGFEDTIVLGGQVLDSLCDYLVQTGPSSYQEIDCGSGGLQAPYVSSVTYSGSWGSAEIGFGGTESITIESNFTQRTVTPEPSSLLLSGMGLAALIGLARRNRTQGQKANPFTLV